MLNDIPAYELALSVSADICARLELPPTVRSAPYYYGKAAGNSKAVQSVHYRLRMTTAVWSGCEAALLGLLDQTVPILCFDPTRDYTHVNHDTYLLHERVQAALASDKLARQLLGKRCAKLDLTFDRLLWGHVLEIPCGDLGRYRTVGTNSYLSFSLS